MYRLQGKPRIIKTDEVLDVVRATALNYVDGVIQNQDQYQFQVRCNVQPVNGRELLLVPEGDRFKEQYFVWAMNKFAGKPILHVNDRIVRQGVSFQVQQVEDWGSYVRARMMAIDVGPDRGQVNAPNTAV